MRFNLGAKKTEAEWAQAIHKFWSSLTQTVFTLVGWAMIVAAISFLYELSGHWVLELTDKVLRFLLFIYIWSYFANLFEIGFWEKTAIRKTWQFLVEAVITGVLAVGLFLMLSYFMRTLISTLSALQS